MVVIGFRDKCLGQYRRDAPTISKLAEYLILAVLCALGFISICGDIKNAYFQGKDFEREVYLRQPKGGLRGIPKGVFVASK